MAAVGMPSSWEELPPDLLGQVLHRLPSLADRVRFCAVCWPWRTVASAERLPPPLPWLAFRDGTLVDLAGAPILRQEGVDFGYLAVARAPRRPLLSDEPALWPEAPSPQVGPRREQSNERL